MRLRLPDRTLDRWERAAELAGAANVQDFVRDAVEERIVAGALTPRRVRHVKVHQPPAPEHPATPTRGFAYR